PRVLYRLHDVVPRTLPLLRQHVQRRHVDVQRFSPSRTPRPASPGPDRRSTSSSGGGRNSTRITAWATCSNATESARTVRPDLETRTTLPAASPRSPTRADEGPVAEPA